MNMLRSSCLLFMGCVLYQSTLVTCWLSRPKQPLALTTMDCKTVSQAFGKRMEVCGNQRLAKRTSSNHLSPLLSSLIANTRWSYVVTADRLLQRSVGRIQEPPSGRSGYSYLGSYLMQRAANDDAENIRLASKFDDVVDMGYGLLNNARRLSYERNSARRLMDDIDEYGRRLPRLYRSRLSMMIRR